MAVAVGIFGTGSFAQSFIPLFRDHPLVSRIWELRLPGLKPEGA